MYKLHFTVSLGKIPLENSSVVLLYACIDAVETDCFVCPADLVNLIQRVRIVNVRISRENFDTREPPISGALNAIYFIRFQQVEVEYSSK